jgi:hypothetical protein
MHTMYMPAGRPLGSAVQAVQLEVALYQQLMCNVDASWSSWYVTPVATKHATSPCTAHRQEDAMQQGLMTVNMKYHESI